MYKIFKILLITLLIVLLNKGYMLTKTQNYLTGELPIVDTTQKFAEFCASNQLYSSLEDYTINAGTLEKTQGISRIYLVRHGQSQANLNGINAGSSIDSPMTPAGYGQAEKAGKMLAKAVDNFSAAYHTPLVRTKQSMDAIARIWNEEKEQSLPESSVVPELIERFCGMELEGATKEYYEPFKKREEKDLAALRNFEDKFNYKQKNEFGQDVEDQESLAEAYERVLPIVKNLAQKHLDQNVLICTHVGVMRALILGLSASDNMKQPGSLELRSFDLPNSSIVVIESDGSYVALKAVNGLNFKK